jgi:tetratricopeptide (TPR) repeat protein
MKPVLASIAAVLCLGAAARGADNAPRVSDALADAGAGAAQTQPAGADVRATAGQVRHDLWQENVAPPDEDPGGADLRKAIRALQELKIRRGEARAEAPVPALPTTTAATAANTATMPAATTTQPASAITETPSGVPTTQPAERLGPETLGRLRTIAAKGISKPMPLADCLYGGGYLDEACVVYELAEKRAAGDDERAWAVYQMANCKRTSQADVALGLYRRVLTEYPDCCWATGAQAQGEIISWLDVNAPRRVLENLQDLPPATAVTTTRPAEDQPAPAGEPADTARPAASDNTKADADTGQADANQS